MNKCRYTKQIIRFRCWSRKRNAAFLSLGRLVTIGTLGKSVTEASLGKQRGVILSDACVWTELGNEREEEDSGGGSDSFVEMIMLSLQPQMAGENNGSYYGRVGDFENREVWHAGNSFTCVPFY